MTAQRGRRIVAKVVGPESALGTHIRLMPDLKVYRDLLGRALSYDPEGAVYNAKGTLMVSCRIAGNIVMVLSIHMIEFATDAETETNRRVLVEVAERKKAENDAASDPTTREMVAQAIGGRTARRPVLAVVPPPN